MNRDGTHKKNTEEAEMQFPLMLASLAHDMKNSLGMLINTTDDILLSCSGRECASQSLLTNLQYEAKRINNSLIQLLALYKIDRDQYTPAIEHHSVAEFLEDALMQHRPLLRYKGIGIETACPEDLVWFFDRELVSGVLNNVLNNSYRYAKSRIRIGAAEEEGFLAIHVEDDGEGYPAHMITGRASGATGINFASGSTGLGLHFAAVVAGMHRNSGRKGHIRTCNAESGGSLFSIYLP